jgi:hypothetical protein
MHVKITFGRGKQILLSALLALSILGPNNPVYAKDDLSEYILEPMPSWYSERYTRGHLDINKMIKDGYTRLEATEIQNQMKDLLDNDPVYAEMESKGQTYEMIRRKDQFILQALEIAIKNVKEKKYFESGFVPETLKDNEFYVVFDLDETLLVQWYDSGLKGPEYYDYKVPVVDNILRPVLTSPDYFSLTPGFAKAIKDIREIPGNKGIIFFSAKLDPAAQSVMDQIKIDGKPIRSFLNGVFTRNYLIREQEPPKLSKDLRIFDESLKRVILIDDNPSRILDRQKKNLREFPKYNPDEYLKAKNVTKDKKITGYFENLLPVVVSEIKEAAEYSRKNKIPFAEAYYPYTADAQTELLMIQEQGASLKDALDIVRKNNKLFEPKFFFYEEKKK